MEDVTVHVQFVDIDTGQVFAETYAQLSSLPKSFEASTHLELNEQHWHVVTADPMTAEQFSRTLILTLRRAQVGTIDPHNILFSLHTICDAIPQH